jgi:hypothetical protein
MWSQSVISQLRDSVVREITESSEVQQLRDELYRVNGSDYSRSIWDTVDGSNCKIVNGMNVRASGINSLYPIRREVNCRALHSTRDNILRLRQFSFQHWCLLPQVMGRTEHVCL